MAMTNDDLSEPKPAAEEVGDGAPKPAAQKPALGFRALFAIPPPVKRVFDKFPVVTYKANELPARAPESREENVLYVFTTEEAAKDGQPSFNPACLKWQAYLKFNSIGFKTFPSNNHASPSGALPFFLPAISEPEPTKAQDPIPSNKLKRWAAAETKTAKLQETDDLRYEAYASLLDNRIRKAWLYQLYLMPANYSLLHELYIAPCSSNPLIQATIAYQLRTAASTELTKLPGANTIVEEDVFRDAQEAYEALSTLLGEDEWFFGQEKPGLFDASVFAYTQLLLDEKLRWKENTLGELLSECSTLVRHRDKIARMYF